MTTTFNVPSKSTPRNVTPWYIRIAPRLPRIMAWALVIFLWAVMFAVFKANMVPYARFFGRFPAVSPAVARWMISPAACLAFQVIQVWPQFVPKVNWSQYRKSLKYSKYAFILEALFSFAIWWPVGGWGSIPAWESVRILGVILLTVFGCSIAMHLTVHYLIKGGKDG